MIALRFMMDADFTPHCLAWLLVRDEDACASSASQQSTAISYGFLMLAMGEVPDPTSPANCHRSEWLMGWEGFFIFLIFFETQRQRDQQPPHVGCYD